MLKLKEVCSSISIIVSNGPRLGPSPGIENANVTDLEILLPRFNFDSE